jgi:uncharacterized protein YdeI (YjbR/CyaY-like superfamily)
MPDNPGSEPATGKDGRPILAFASQQAWEQWLEEFGATSKGVWAKIAKKASGVDSVSMPEAVESALCFGWIDGQRLSHDDQYYLQKFTPRTPRSRWSRINRDRVTQLIERGRVRPAGLAEVERARKDGRWDAAYDSPRNATIPDDLQRELDNNPAAAAFFATLNSTNRFAILYRLHDAKKPETRARRLATFIAMLNEGKTLYP